MEGAVTLGEFLVWLSKVKGTIDRLPTEELTISREGLSDLASGMIFNTEAEANL